MTNNLESAKFADLTHQYHDKYRTAGIALCISIATVASAEGWWFYGLFKSDVAIKCDMFQILLCYIVIISAICLFALTFVLQFLNYDGVRHMAHSFFYAYKISEKKEKTLKTLKEKEWKSATDYFKKADTVIKWLKVLIVINFSAAIFYIGKYLPNK